MEKINIDLNNLFNLSYNFENLKLLLTSISKNQDIFESRLKDLDEKMIGNSKIINELKEKEEKKNSEENQEIDKKLSKEAELQEKMNYKLCQENQNQLSELNNKITVLENYIKSLSIFIPSFPEDKTKTLNEILDINKLDINNNKEGIKEIKNDVSSIKNNLEELTLKVKDFDVYSIFKGMSDNSNVDISKVLIEALDKKCQERFKFQDEKIKDAQREVIGIKNETINIKNNSSLDKRNINLIKEQLLKIQNDIESNHKNNNEKINKHKKEIETIKEKDIQNTEDINGHFNDINEVISKLEKEVKNLSKDDKKNKTFNIDLLTKKQKNDIVMDSEIFIEFKDNISKILGNLDRKYQTLLSDIKTEYFQNELNNIKLELNSKKQIEQEFYEIKLQSQQFNELFESVKDDNHNIQVDMKKLRENMSDLNKKYESMILKSMNLGKDNQKSDETKENEYNDILRRLDNYVEISIFNEFIKEQTKFSEKLKKDFESYKHFYDEIIEALKKAASVQDLKSLEEYFIDLLDEFKDRTNKLYPKKSDMNKNFKSIELQIRQLYEYILKKDGHAESWLIAKKPLGGCLCASCENYIGDIKENNEKVFWNQMPDKDINPNSSRIGNGFSRILNMVQINQEMRNESPFSKKDFGENVNNELDNRNDNKDDLQLIEKKNMSNTVRNNISNTKFKETSMNNKRTNTNIQGLRKNSLSQEDLKFGLTSNECLNAFKEMKNKKMNNILPPIIHNNDAKENSLCVEYNEENKDNREGPKVMKIIRKKK